MDVRCHSRLGPSPIMLQSRAMCPVTETMTEDIGRLLKSNAFLFPFPYNAPLSPPLPLSTQSFVPLNSPTQRSAALTHQAQTSHTYFALIPLTLQLTSPSTNYDYDLFRSGQYGPKTRPRCRPRKAPRMVQTRYGIEKLAIS